MKYRELLKFIEGGENLHCEFKLHFSSHEKIAKELMAFANTSGGHVILGVDDDKNIVGVESEKGEAELIEATVRNYCEPPIEYTIEYFSIEKKEIVVVNVPESKTKPHRLQDFNSHLDIRTAQVYVRVNDKSVQASKEMIRILRSQNVEEGLYKYSIGDHEKGIFRFLEAHESITVKECCELLNLSVRRASRTLVKLVRAGALVLHIRESGEDYYTLKSEVQN